ncbi:uncharacterized protein LOC124261716 [Haliotis rubra]|uniref:uncharacterized protein LOC124261716 n=1 Tax=Haliotis rubra TaxID=36100 RepID=UPI001EE54644|nr:uncharacterized protein LOC124261716 [Haliotis rubra]
MLKLSGICVALLGLVLTVNGQTVAPDPRCNAFPNGEGNIMAEGLGCRYYLSCFNFIINRDPMACAGETLFNPNSGMCDAEECTDNRGVSNYDCEEGALPNDCSRFNICFNTPNDTTIFQCGEDTYYHNAKRVCVHPDAFPNLPREQGCTYNPL